MSTGLIVFKELFKFLIPLKLYHYTVKSGFKHEKVDLVFIKVLELTDKFLEVLQGKSEYGRIVVKKDFYIEVRILTDQNIDRFAEDYILFLEGELVDMIMDHDDLDNIRQEILALINQFRYFMTFS